MKWITRERPKIDRFEDDYEMLKHGMVVYDAIYAWCAETPLQKAGRLLRRMVG